MTANERRLIPGLAEDPERRYSPGGTVAHLVAYGSSGGDVYAPGGGNHPAYCGWQSDEYVWLGSADQDEIDRANTLPVCKRCMKVADETAALIRDLASVGDPDA